MLVMFHDVQESGTIFGKDPMVHPLAISLQYWLREGTKVSNELPLFPTDLLNHLSGRYSQLKKKRRLKWIPELSNVDMDIVIEALGMKR